MAQVTLAADTIALGDQTILVVPQGMELAPTQGVEVLDMRPDTAAGGMQALVTSFEPGEHWLHVGNDSLLLVVTDVEVDTTTAEIRDIAPIQRVPHTFWEIFRWVLLAWAIAAVAIVVWCLVDRKKRHGSIFVRPEPVDTRTPEERALQALEGLRNNHVWQSGKVKEYHTELTDIVRRFVEETTDIRATELTSDETVESVSLKIGKQLSGLLRSIFTTADLVKFAKSEPLPHEHEASMGAAVEFIRQMWQQVKPEVTEENETGEKEVKNA